MLIIKYILSVIAVLSTLLFICGIISDMILSPYEKAQTYNTTIDKIYKNSEIFRFILIIILSLIWPSLFIFF